jgi:hypothetical protein
MLKRRACRVKLVEDVAKLDDRAGTPLPVRIGIAMGLAVVPVASCAKPFAEYHRRSCRGRVELSSGNWRCQGNRDLLGPVYGWFTERFNAPVLQEAKALVDELT